MANILDLLERQRRAAEAGCGDCTLRAIAASSAPVSLPSSPLGAPCLLSDLNSERNASAPEGLGCVGGCQHGVLEVALECWEDALYDEVWESGLVPCRREGPTCCDYRPSG